MDLSAKAILVVGAARPPGIGRATALRLARASARLVLADAVDVSQGDAGTGRVAAAKLAEVAAEVSEAAGRPVAAFPVDPTDPASVEELVARAVGELGRLDACCNMVGATGPALGDGPLAATGPDAWQRGLDWNLTAAWLIARACVPPLTAAGGGAIVTLSSYAGLTPVADAGVVGVARAAVNHLTAALAGELGPLGIRVNTVCPLGVHPGDPRFPNPGLVRLAEREGLPLADWLARTIPLGRGQSADEVAAAVEFLVSDAASFVSGVNLPVAGGAAA
ncbi:SDR family oxidoreductase [Nonomuraea sp. NPDC049486]|uniref:SDR family NAD(P)-dependent oxidoreductase n=1 Tax=Nonomuraea sp. NPDC049486 TaxID=3155773 RepID=UPI0034479BCC